MAYRILSNQREVAEYDARLDAGWPVRTEIANHMSRQLVNLSSTSSVHIVELCCGPGRLAETLLRDHKNISYTGLDVSAESLRFAQHRLAEHSGRIHFIEADLNSEGWWDQIKPPISAIVIMQAMHDIGDQAAVERIYRIAQAELARGALLLNADLLAYTVDNPASNPGRLTIPHHLQLLKQVGFSAQYCTWEKAGFGCVAAWTAL